MAITGNDLLKKRRGSAGDDEKGNEENSSQVTGSALLEKRKLYQTVDTDSVNDQYVKSFIADANKLLSSSEIDENGYSTWKELNTRADTISGWLYKNKDKISASNYNSLASVVSDFQNKTQKFSQFETEDAYKEHVAWQKDYNEKLNYDLEAAKAEIEALEAEYVKPPIVFGLINEFYDQIIKPEFPDSKAPFDGKVYEAEEIEAILNEKKQYYTLAERVQKAANLASVADPDSENYDPEFEKYSGYVSTTAKSKFDEDITYEYINGDEKKRSQLESKYREYLLKNVIDKGYGHLTEKEKSIYNYYYAKGGKAAAEEYLETIQESLNYQQAEAVFQNVKDNPLLEYTFAVNSGTEQFYSGLENMFSNEDYIPITAYEYASGMIREDLADTGPDLPDWLGGASLGQIGYDALNTTANMLPSVLVSTGVGMINPVAGQVVGAGLLGLSAGGNARAEMLRLGYSKAQANTYGVMVAAAEGGMEYLLGGITQFGGVLPNGVVSAILSHVDNAFARVAIQIGGSMLSEGFEEGLQTVIEPWLKEIATGVDWDDPKLDEVLYSSLLGAITAFFLEGPQTATQNIASNRYASKMYGDVSSELVAEALEIDPNNKYAQKMQNRLNSGKNLSGAQINRIIDANESAMLSQDVSAIQNATKERLAALGETGNIEVIAKILTKQAQGEKLSLYEEQAIKNSKYGQRVANELNTDNILSGQYSSAWAEQIGTNRINAEEYSRALAEAESIPVTDTNAGSKTVEAPSPVTQAPTQQAENTSTAENATVKENATESEFEASVEASESGESENTLTIEDASKKYGAQAQAMIHTYTEGQDVTEYDNAYGIAYNMGMSGVSLSYAMNSEGTSYLTEAQRELAYEAGKAAADTSAKEQDTKNKSLINGKTGRKKGTVKGEGVTISDLKKTFNDTQNTAYKILTTYAEATGIDIVLYKSEPNANGEFVGGQGKFKWSDDKIYIDINAGLKNIKSVDDLAKYAMLRTFSHEFTHFIEKWNPIWYNEFRKAVFDELTARGENVHDLIETKMSMNEGMSYDKASREVVAEAMTDILPDATFVETLATKHKNIFEKLLDKLKEFLADLKAYFKTIGHNPSREANALKDQVDGAVHYVDNIVKLFDKVALEAVENYQATVATEEATVSKTEQVAPTQDNAQVDKVVDNSVDETVTETTNEVDEKSEGDAFTITDNAEYGSLEIKFDGKPSEAIRNVLKEHNFRWHKVKGVWYGKGDRADIVSALREAYKSQNNISEGDIANGTEQSEEKHIPDRRKESGIPESQGSTRAENENRSRIQGDDRGTPQEVERTLRNDRGFLGVSNDSNESPFDASDIVQVTPDSVLYEQQQKLINEYGIECYIIKSSAWEKTDPSVLAAAYKGKVYVREDLSGDIAAATAPHESTHVMGQLKYQPYLNFVDKVADMLDLSNDYTQDLFDWLADYLDLDYTSMNASNTRRFYDELNANIYGFYKTTLFESEGYSKWMPNAFYDFDSYIAELDAIHEQYKKEHGVKAEAGVKAPDTVEEAQEVPFDKRTLSLLKKAKKVGAIEFKGQHFVSSGMILFPTTKAGVKYAKVELNATTLPPDIVDKIISADYTQITNAPVEGQFNAYQTVYAFDIGDKKRYFDKKLLSHLDGGTLYYSDYKNPVGIIKSVNGDGSVKGYLLGMVPPRGANLIEEKQSKLKSFSKKTNAKEVNQNGENADNKRPILEPDADGERASRLLDESQTEDVQGTSSERNSVEDTRQRESETERHGDRTDAADRIGRSERNSEVGDLRLNDDLTEEETQAKAEELAETVEREIEQKSTEHPKGNNFVISDSLNLPNGEKARYRANVDAIRLIKQLETEGRYATAAEQEILSKYVGWGGLSNAFGELIWNRETRRSEMTPKDEWKNEFAELKGLVDEGIITEQEYNSMSGSTKNAHYTSIEVIKAMYDGLAGLGFKGGRMLEPSSGVGNFVGAMPANMAANVNSWTMVEIERITGLIAKYLYPNSDVRIQGFENANIPDNYMDVAIGNVPFGDYGVVDRAYPKRITKAIHNYFFAKSIDKVRPGGIVMFITSSFTMNAKDTTVRQYIMDRADLLGAIRLPNTAFKGNAGTEVVTDILILKKRENGTEYAGEDFLEADYDYNYGAYTSNYFKNHPEMVLGKPVNKRGMYGANTLTFEPFTDRGTIDDQIREAFKNIKGKMDYPTKRSPEKTNFAVEKATKKAKSGGFVVNSDGSISKKENGQLVKYDTDEKTAKRIAGLLSIRDAYRTLANYLQQGQDKKYVKQARTALNAAYDKFVKEYGYLNTPANKKAMDSDPDQYSILSLENYDAKKKTAKKADIFTKDTISANKTITHVDSVEEGVIASINLTGGVDTALIAKLTGKAVDDVTREVIDSRLAFKTRDNGLVARESYLSGNVRAKLRDAEALAPYDKDFNNNIEELKKVIPADIPYHEIYITPGATFIPNEVYADFIAHMLGGRNNPNSYSGPDVEVGRMASGEFKIILNNKRLKGSYYNTQTWGTARKSFLDLIDAMMGSRTVKVNDTMEGPDGRKISVVNEAETEAANEKVKAIQKEFEDWIWKDEDRRNALARLYNETFNAIVNPKYDGSHLSVNGINAEYSLRPHQANAVHRIISSGGNTLLAHRVGAGKTLEMAAAAMKMRELGVIKKPVFVVPKNVVAQWGVEFHNYFPAARLLVADDKSFTPANRKIFTNQIANGDYDAVIVSYEQFEKIPMSVEYQQRFYEEQIDEIINAIAEEKAESRDGKGLTVKEMEKKKAQLEKKLKELTSKPKDENNIDFEMLGIDSLFVDEAHNFKNLEYVSKMSNVAGLGPSKGAQRAFDLYTKIRYLQGLNGGRGIVFATATPVMNSMVELYIMQRYLQPDVLNQLGLKSFDAWAKQFGEVVNKWEINPSGTGMRQKQVFANFRNLNELQLLFRSFSDVLTEVPGLKIPKMKGGAVKIVECEPGEFQKNYMLELQKRAENVKNVDPTEDNMLKITSDGRKISYTQRMIDPTLPYEPTCKIFMTAENILKEYKDSADIKGTQIVFLDMATPKGADKSKTETNTDDSVDDGYDEESARLYDDMRDYLVKKGIPKSEIAFIHEANTDAKKAQLFEDVNSGKVRVLMGSTGKMGVGMNAQKRVVAIHHLDAPWRPGDVEQRDGRAFRQKNINEEVSKYVYVTKGSFDSRLWDILDRKQHFINQIMNGEDVGRTAEDTGEVTLSAAEVKALASGNPLIEEQTKLTDAIKKLENLQKAYNSSIVLAKTKLSDDELTITNYKNRITRVREDIAARVDTYSEDKFSMTVGKQIFTDKKEAGAALAAEILAKATADSYATVGKFAGFEIKAIKNGAEYSGLIHGKESYKFNVYLNNTTRMVNHIGDIIAGFENMIKYAEQMIDEATADRDAQKNIIAQPFEKQEELAQKRARFNEVMELLAPKTEEQHSKVDDDTVQEQSREYLDDNYNLSNKGKVAKLTDERIEHLLSEYGASNPQYAQAYITSIHPRDFLSLTLSDQSLQKWNNAAELGTNEELYPLDVEKLKRQTQTPFLEVDTRTGEIVGHEGRHRMRALLEAGVEEVPIAILDYNTKYSKRKETSMRLTSQDFGDGGVNNDFGAEIKNLIPINQVYKEEIKSLYGGNGDISFQQRTDTLTDREVLELAANEIKVSDLTQAETDALAIFQDRLSTLKDLQDERAEQGRLYKEQQFGEKVDRKAAEETLNRMHILDGQIKKATNDILNVEEKEVLKRVLHKARKVVEAQEREHGKEILNRWRDRRNNAAAIKKYRDRLRGDVDELSNWILHPNNKDIVKHVPDVLKNSVIPFLSSINFMSKRSLKGGAATKADAAFMEQLEKLNRALKTNIELNGLYSGYNDLPPNFMENLQRFIDSANVLVKKQSGVLVINQMTSEELKELSQIVRTLKKFIMQVNIFHNNAMYQHVYEAGENSIEHLAALGNAEHTGVVSKFLLWQQIRPAYAFERFGKGGEAIYDGLRRGQAKLAFNTRDIQEFTEKAYTEKEVKAWEDEIKEFKLGRDIVKMPVSYIMAFYELSKDPEALEHINGEGIRVATYTHKGKKISDTGHILTVGEFNQIIGSLTDRQREVADTLQKYMAEQGGKWGNYVSVARFGEELFTNKKYFPINSDGRHLQANTDEHPSAASLYALLNMSFTKSRKEGANNRIVIYSIFDVFANHMASMAQYNAMALPILDAIKWFNYQQVFIDDDGNKHIGDSVRERMDRAYGVPEETKPGSGNRGYAQDFVMNIIKAFNGTEAQGTPYDSIALKSLHRYNIAQVAYNARVVVQQPLAITRAGLLIDYNSIIRGMKLKPSAIKKNIEEMQKYSGIAAWKSLGFYDVNISRGLTHIIKHDSTFMDKVGDVGMWGAEKADLLTWAAIWSACKEEVTKKQYLTPSSKGFYEAVTKLFEDIIYKTQVVDSVLTKNEFMRDKGAVARLTGSFMSEPTTNASMVIDAFDKYALDMQRGMTIQQAWNKNKKMIGRALYVYAVGAILLAAVQAAADAWRDDDEYETLPEKWLEAFIGNLVDELMPFNKLPILSDFYDLAKEMLSIFGVDTYGNPPQSVYMQWYDTLIKGTEIIYTKIAGEDTNYTWYGGIYKLLQTASGITGLPMASATREIIAAWNNTIGAMAPSLKVTDYEPSELSQIRYAYEDGYLTDIEAAAKMIDKGLAESENEAYGIILYWQYKEKHPHSDVYDDWFVKYYSDVAPSGMTLDDYLAYRADVKDIAGEDKKARRMAVINSLPITNAQKDALYFAEGWAESKLHEAPWH